MIGALTTGALGSEAAEEAGEGGMEEEDPNDCERKAASLGLAYR